MTETNQSTVPANEMHILHVGPTLDFYGPLVVEGNDLARPIAVVSEAMVVTRHAAYKLADGIIIDPTKAGRGREGVIDLRRYGRNGVPLPPWYVGAYTHDREDVLRGIGQLIAGGTVEKPHADDSWHASVFYVYDGMSMREIGALAVEGRDLRRPLALVGSDFDHEDFGDIETKDAATEVALRPDRAARGYAKVWDLRRYGRDLPLPPWYLGLVVDGPCRMITDDKWEDVDLDDDIYHQAIADVLK